MAEQDAYDEATVTLTQEEVDAIWAYIEGTITGWLRDPETGKRVNYLVGGAVPVNLAAMIERGDHRRTTDD